MKGLTISAQMLKFLAGLIIAVCIGFAIMIFLYRNYYERIAEQNYAKLYHAIEVACENGESSTSFMLPQNAGIKGLVQQTLGISGANIGSDPYFYVYYEEFPSYQWSMWETYINGVKVQDPISGLIIPWSEDTPWSTNMMMTLAIDTAFLGISPGFGKLKGSLEKVGGRIKNALVESEKISKAMKAGKIVYKGGKVIITEAKHFAETTAAATFACFALTDLSLGECAYYSVWVYPVLRSTSYIIPKVISKRIENAKNSRILQLKDEILTVMEETSDDAESVWDDLVTRGKIKKIGNKYYVEDDEVKDALFMIAKERGEPEMLGSFRFTDQGIEIDEDSFIKKIKEGFSERFNSLKASIGNVFGDEAIAGKGLHNFANQIDYIANDEELAWEIVKTINAQGLDTGVWSKVDAQKYLRELAEKIRSMADDGSVLLLPKDSKLLEVVEKYGLSDDQTLAKALQDYLKDIPNNPKEAVYLHYAKKGTRFLFTEQLKEKLAPYGYIWLRFQDMYTIAGGTYWDKQISYYTTTGTYCGKGEICLQEGYYVIRQPLPKSCKNKGITNIKLERNSLVASNPRFYLVSPCFANLYLYTSGDTLYIKPIICNQDSKPEEFKDVPNYCYATEGVVNYYVSMEAGSWFADCAVAILCNVLLGAQGGIGIIDIIQCLTLGIAPSNVKTLCGFLGNGVRLFLDVTRDAIINYPYIPESILGTGECSW